MGLLKNSFLAIDWNVSLTFVMISSGLSFESPFARIRLKKINKQYMLCDDEVIRIDERDTLKHSLLAANHKHVHS